ncbi:DUF1902 domain-containing protein [Desulfonatronum thiodismutans]
MKNSQSRRFGIRRPGGWVAESDDVPGLVTEADVASFSC